MTDARTEVASDSGRSGEPTGRTRTLRSRALPKYPGRMILALALALAWAVLACGPQPARSHARTEPEPPVGASSAGPSSATPDPDVSSSPTPLRELPPPSHATCVHRGARTDPHGTVERCRTAAFATEPHPAQHPPYPAGEAPPAGQLLPPSLRAELAEHCQRLQACVDAARKAEPKLDVQGLGCLTWSQRAELWPDAKGALTCVRLEGEIPASLATCALDALFTGRGIEHVFREAPDCAGPPR